jgi:hypothetical protein
VTNQLRTDGRECFKQGKYLEAFHHFSELIGKETSKFRTSRCMIICDDVMIYRR